MVAVAKKKELSKNLRTFKYECKNQQGHKVTGEVIALSMPLAKADLIRQGLTPVKVKKLAKPILIGGKKKISATDIAYFSRQMATMMSAGVPLVQSFDIVAKGTDNPSVRALVLKIILRREILMPSFFIDFSISCEYLPNKNS